MLIPRTYVSGKVPPARISSIHSALARRGSIVIGRISGKTNFLDKLVFARVALNDAWKRPYVQGEAISGDLFHLGGRRLTPAILPQAASPINPDAKRSTLNGSEAATGMPNTTSGVNRSPTVITALPTVGPLGD